MADEALIEIVRGNRELYDTRDPNYMKTKRKNLIWEGIAKELQLKDGEEAKSVWIKLRSGYRDARRRQQRCLRSGAAATTIKQWKFQKQMSFLEPFMTSGARSTNINDEDSDTPMPVDEDSTSVTEGTQSTEVTQLTEGTQPNEVLNSDGEDDGFISTLPSTSTSTPTVKKTNKNDLHHLLQQTLRNRDERSKRRAQERSYLEDPLYNFFFSMYQLTKQLDPALQFQVRRDVFNVVSNAEGTIYYEELAENQ